MLTYAHVCPRMLGVQRECAKKKEAAVSREPRALAAQVRCITTVLLLHITADINRSPARSLCRYALNAEIIYYYCILLLTLTVHGRCGC